MIWRIDTAFISKFKINNPKLHYVKFSPKYETKDTRPIFEITIMFEEKLVKIYNVHFPSNFNDLEMRLESFDLFVIAPLQPCLLSYFSKPFL